MSASDISPSNVAILWHNLSPTMSDSNICQQQHHVMEWCLVPQQCHFTAQCLFTFNVCHWHFHLQHLPTTARSPPWGMTPHGSMHLLPQLISSHNITILQCNVPPFNVCHCHLPWDICQQQQGLSPWGMMFLVQGISPHNISSPMRHDISWHEAISISMPLSSHSKTLCLSLWQPPSEAQCLMVHHLPHNITI